MHLLFRWFVLTVAVWAAATIVPGIDYTDPGSLLATGLVLGLLNAFVKPLLQLLSLPFILITLGLFVVVVNALVLLLAAWLVPGFHVAGFWPATGGSLVISAVSLFLGPPRARGRAATLRVERNDPPPGTGPIIDV